MTKTMALHHLLPCLTLPLLATLLAGAFAADSSNQTSPMYPLNCSQSISTCNALLYHDNTGLSIEQIQAFYSVSPSQINPILHGNQQDYLIIVPCSCKDIDGARGYFYETTYPVKEGDTFLAVSNMIYSGQAWMIEGVEKLFITGHNVSMNLLCGCIESDSQVVVTYTVQQGDTLSDISTLLSAKISAIQSMNKNLIRSPNPEFIQVGWVLFVPMEKDGIPKPSKGIKQKWVIIIAVLSAVASLSVIALIIILLRRQRSKQSHEKNQKAVSRALSANRAFSLQSQRALSRSCIRKENLEEGTAFESERPVIFSLQEIEEATCNFDESKKIGEGGYGCVYFGLLGEQEVAIKKMRSNKSKEFFAELKVLCKIHHINVVELLGYASGDDHLYLVYEYIPKGSLGDHLHDPLLKGHQPLSWTARTLIALDAAKGIEYIHDHTKARYVHRDIKTTNILLDEGLRAKVADFGLVKLVERTNEDDYIATRLVGTPGYLPPESVKELQVTPKTDVFAFGVVLAELITGQRALTRDNREPSKMKSLIAVVYNIFLDEDPESALEAVIDGNLRGSYPMEDISKMAELAHWCLSEEAVNRPEMREIVITLSQIVQSSVEWEASLGGNSQVFSGIFNGR